MASRQYFEFIADVNKRLPSEDQERMAELWKGMEQALASIYQKHIEASFGVSIEKIFTYSDERWLPYTFNSDNKVIQAATYITNQDLSVGANLSDKYLIRLSWDDNPPIEINVRGPNPQQTTTLDVVNKINFAVGFNLAKLVSGGGLIQFTSPTVGEDSKITFYPPSSLLNDASEFVLGLVSSELPMSYPEFNKCYSLPYPNIKSIPAMRDAIRDPSVERKIHEGVDYVIEENLICFKEDPPENLWAKRTLFNEEYPWNNFGFLMDIYQENSQRYVQILQGLWFAFWTGPRPENMRRALYLMFELPVSPFDGTVTSLTPTSIAVTSDKGETASFEIPSGLVADVELGERVDTFTPLVSGIQVIDKVNLPGFIETEIGRYGIQRFLLPEASRGPGPDTDETRLLRILEEYTFLPQISVDAFVNPEVNLGNVRLFLDAIKPVVKTYLFQVIVGTFRDEMAFDDKVGADIDMDVTPNVDYNETTPLYTSTLLAHETTTNPGLTVDTEGALIQEELEIEVRSFGVLLDIFEA